MNRKKLTIIVFIAFAAIALFVITAFAVRFVTSRKYSCYYYTEEVDTEEVDGQSVSVIENYKYFKLELKKDKTFVMKFKGKNASEPTEIAGTYSENDNKITLVFVNRPVEFLLFESLTFTRSGKELHCRETASKTIDDVTHTSTMELKFKKTLF
jgi:LPS O-antigen subunit length determinant protein (WzzB/FepE family)